MAHGDLKRAAIPLLAATLLVCGFLLLRERPQEPAPRGPGTVPPSPAAGRSPPEDPPATPVPEAPPAIEENRAHPPNPPGHRRHEVKPDGLPLDGATVRAGEGAEILTNAEGRFEIPGARAVEFLTVHRDGYLKEGVRPGEGAGELRIVLQEALVVRGRARLRSGHGVPGITVTDGNRGVSVHTDEKGAYALVVARRLPQRITCGNFARVEEQRISDTELDFLIQDPAVTVSVVDEEGRPVVEAKVNYRMESGGREVGGGFFNSTSSAGIAVLVVRPATTVFLTVTRSGFHPGKGVVEAGEAAGGAECRVVLRRHAGFGSVRVELSAGEGKRPTAVQVHAVDESGEVVGGLWRKRIEVGPDGIVDLGALPEGPLTLTLSDDSAEDWKNTFAVPGVLRVEVVRDAISECRHTFVDGGRAMVSFTDAGGAPLVPESIGIRDIDGKDTGVRFGFENRNGEWTDTPDQATPGWSAPPLPAGEYHVLVWEAGGEDGRPKRGGSRKARITPGAVTPVVVRQGSFEE